MGQGLYKNDIYELVAVITWETVMNFQRGNLLLEQLPTQDLQRLLPYLQLVSLAKDQVVYQQDEVVDYFYFPLTAVVSFAIQLPDGIDTHVALADSSSMFPLSVVVDSHCLLGVHVRIPGLAYRMPVDVLRREFSQCQAFAKLVMKAVRNLLGQLSLSSACFRRHSTQQILAKVLLVALQHRVEQEIEITHGQIADIVGVRREAITLTLKQLEQRGVVECLRGKIRLRDRPMLEDMVCTCYRARKQLGVFQRLLV
jgi:CRP-like cAMP-binding protein